MAVARTAEHPAASTARHDSPVPAPGSAEIDVAGGADEPSGRPSGHRLVPAESAGPQRGAQMGGTERRRLRDALHRGPQRLRRAHPGPLVVRRERPGPATQPDPAPQLLDDRRPLPLGRVGPSLVPSPVGRVGLGRELVQPRPVGRKGRPVEDGVTGPAGASTPPETSALAAISVRCAASSRARYSRPRTLRSRARSASADSTQSSPSRINVHRPSCASRSVTSGRIPSRSRDRHRPITTGPCPVGVAAAAACVQGIGERDQGAGQAGQRADLLLDERRLFEEAYRVRLTQDEREPPEVPVDRPV